jgi:hypothetical protein
MMLLANQWCTSLTASQNFNHLGMLLANHEASDSVTSPSQSLPVGRHSLLTKLSPLDVAVGLWVNGVTVGSTLSCLTGLQQHLGLDGVLQSLQPLSAIARVKQLRSLRIMCDRSMQLSSQDLGVLYSLRQCMSPVVPLAPECTAMQYHNCAVVVCKWLVDMPCLELTTSTSPRHHGDGP